MKSLTAQYECVEPGRVIAVRAQGALNGMEYLEVASTDQMTLQVMFVLPLPGVGNALEAPPGRPALTAANFRIEGGVRIRDIRVVSVASANNVLTLVTSAAGDFSTYTLRLVQSEMIDDVPDGFDPRLSSIEFSFKAGCPSEFDCKRDDTSTPQTLAEPAINYRAKDYASFRRLMLDRLNVLMPNWRDRSPADPLVTMVEALALTADHLSYWQDAIATEAYLGTARRRVSLRRHARMLDYPMHEGCNARTWVHFALENGAGTRVVPANTLVLTRGSNSDVVLNSAKFADALREGPTVFATMHEVSLRPEHNAIAFYTWSDTACCLAKGATRATLLNASAVALNSGDWLLFEEAYGPTTGLEADADPTHRQVVRLTKAEPRIDPLNGTAILEIEWDAADALRFSLCLEVVSQAGPGTLVSIARGNLALADHGIPVRDDDIRLEAVAADRPPGSKLRDANLTFAEPFDAARFREEAIELELPANQKVFGTFLTARAALRTSAALAVPSITLSSGTEVWQARNDLLMTDRFANEFVVEMENDGTASLRFGDNVHGVRPADDVRFTATYRVGGGRAGNVGADSLGRVVAAIPQITRVRNPLAAVGGVDRESMESVRQFAPQAFRRQERAVTEADWAEVAERDASVQRAVAQYRWTGSWHTAFVGVDWIGGISPQDDPDFVQRFAQQLDRYRLAGYDLEVEGPLFAPLDIRIKVCAKPGYFRSDVKAALLDTFSATTRRNGTRGFFHPDNFTFGQPLYISRVYEAAMKVAGVESVRVVRFRRYGKVAANEIADGLIAMSRFEVVRCDNDPSFPESGRFEVDVDGGL